MRSALAGILRAVLWGFGIGGILVALLFGYGPMLVKKASGQVPAVQPDPRVEWTEVQAGNLILVNPTVRDSLGRPVYFVIPPGSILMIPRLVPDKEGMS